MAAEQMVLWDVVQQQQKNLNISEGRVDRLLGMHTTLRIKFRGIFFFKCSGSVFIFFVESLN